MTARSAPRMSSLVNVSPIVAPTPEPQPVEEVAAVLPKVPAATPVKRQTKSPAKAKAPASGTAPSSAAAKTAPKASVKPKAAEPRKYPPKVTFYQTDEETARVRATIIHIAPRVGSMSMSEFIHRAVMEQVERYEDEFNNGEPFPAVQSVPRGRPLR